MRDLALLCGSTVSSKTLAETRVTWRTLCTCLFPLMILWTWEVSAEELQIRVFAISAADERAIVSMSAGESLAVKVGDVVLGGRYVVEAIRNDVLVLVEQGPQAEEGNHVWVYVADEAGRSRVMRIGVKPEDVDVPTKTVVESGVGSAR